MHQPVRLPVVVLADVEGHLRDDLVGEAELLGQDSQCGDVGSGGRVSLVHKGGKIDGGDPAENDGMDIISPFPF